MKSASARDVMVRRAFLLAGLAAFCMDCACGQSWATGYPKLQFGATAFSSALTFPVPLGSWIPEGKSPQDLVLRFKVSDIEGASHFTGSKIIIELQLSEFMGGDNMWSKTSSNLRVMSMTLNSMSFVSAPAKLAPDAVQWSATSNTLTVAFENILEADIKDSEIALILAAASFVGGNGPIAPRCLELNAPIYVKRFVNAAGVEVPALCGVLPSVAPIGCFGDVSDPFGVLKSSWEQKYIGQSASTNGVGMDVTITVTLSSRRDIYSVTASVKSEIIILGLVETQTADNTALPIDVLGTKLFSALDLFETAAEAAGTTNTLNTGIWKQATGTLTLTIKDGRKLPAGIPFVFSFKLKLPPVPSSAKEVYVMAKTGTTVVIPQEKMDTEGGDSAPLTTRERTFISARISQSVSGGGQENIVLITLISNFDIQSTTSYISKIMISGLVGASSPDSSDQYPYPVMPVSEDSVQGIFSDGHTVDRAKWLKSKGEIILQIETGKFLRAGTEYVFSTKLLNQLNPRESTAVYIQASGETNTPQIEMQRGQGDEAPMYISEPAMSIAKISQSSSSYGADNVLTISLQSTMGIQSLTGGQISSAITITGLSSGFSGTRFQSSDGHIPVTNMGYNTVEGLFVENSAKWDKSSGKLVIDIVGGQQLRASRLYVFSVTLTNPNAAQASPDVQIEISGASSAVSKVMKMEKASQSSAPLYVEAPTFKVLRMGQKYSGPGESNELTMTLKPNLMLSRGTTFTIEGLTASATSNTPQLSVSGCDGIFEFQEISNVGRWSQLPGTLELNAATDIPDSAAIICTFSLLSPTAPQSASRVSVTVKSAAVGQIQTLIGPEIFRNAPGKSAPFMVLPSTFLSAEITQDSPYPGEQKNRITVSLMSNVAIGSAGGIVSSITITGLTGSQTSDTRALQLYGNFTKDVESFAEWTTNSGTVIITIKNSKTMKANTLYIVSFFLANPSKEQSSPAVSISSSGGQAITSMPMSSDKTKCIHSNGDSAPLFVYPRGFLVKDIGIRASWPQASNILSITLQSSVSISSLPTSRTSISISGLKFGTKFDPALSMSSSEALLFGTTVEWNAPDSSGESHLVIKISSSGHVLKAGKQYQIDVPFENAAKEILFKPFISVNGPVTIDASEMTYGGKVLPVKVAFTTLQPGINVGMTIVFTTRRKIFKADTIVVLLPGFEGKSTDSGSQIWGVTSDPPAFTTELSDLEYADAIAGGESVAEARYRVGSSSRTEIGASDADGERGSTIVLNSIDTNVLGKSNVYAGMQLSISGSNQYHHIYRQVASAPNLPATASFYPKNKFGEKDAAAVPAGALYTIISQLELTSKQDICAGATIRIVVPSVSGILNPPLGIQKSMPITLSHVKAGTALYAIGTPDTITADLIQSNKIASNIKISLKNSFSADLFGLPWAPTRISPASAVFVDGFRPISESNSTNNEIMILTGYGPIRKTKIAAGNAFKIVGTKLAQAKNIPKGSADMWLTLDSIDSIRPVLSQGSYIQLKEEILRYTGVAARSLISITAPNLVGADCKLNGLNCGIGNICYTIAWSGCSEAPSVSVAMMNGSFHAFTINYGGACLETENLQGTLLPTAGVRCTTAPDCGIGCMKVLATAQNVVKVQRSQFSTPAVSLICDAGGCSDLVRPNAIYLQNNGIQDLLYTPSSTELDLANNQSVKIGYKQIVDTVVAGDHVESITLPEVIGSNCRLVTNGVSTGQCSQNEGCASIIFSGCSVNPNASLTFENGKITNVVIESPGICQTAEVLVGKILVGAETKCDINPRCATGCLPRLDSSRDTIIIKHRAADMLMTLNHEPEDDVVRVHSTENNIGYQIVVVPSTECTVSLLEATFLPGQCSFSPRAGTVVTWTDPDTAGVLASMHVTTDGLSSLCLDFQRGVPEYPPTCVSSCENKTANGNLIGSKLVNITLKYEGNGTGIEVSLFMPITFNKRNHSSNDTVRRVSPNNFEYRLNGDCKCPSSQDESVNCTIRESGLYQVHLVKLGECKAVNQRRNWVVAGVLGGVSAFLISLLCCYAFWYRAKAQGSSKTIDTEPALEENGGYEGPVYVGRPIPLTPTMQPYALVPAPASISPAPIMMLPYPHPNHNTGSPGITFDATAWNNSSSYMGSLPATLTPAARPTRSPVLNMSSSMAQISTSSPDHRSDQGREDVFMISPRMVSPRRRSVSPDGRSPRSARMPYGV